MSSRSGAVAGEALTERECEVLVVMALGWSNRRIAQKLKLSEHTVKFHVGNIIKKLDAYGRTDACVKAQWRGLLGDGSPQAALSVARAAMREALTHLGPGTQAYDVLVRALNETKGTA